MYYEKSEFPKADSNVVNFPAGSKPKLKLVTTSLQDTYHKDLPPPAAIIDRAVYQGLTILAGPPKVGKSYLALELANSVASGEPALGGLDVRRSGRVLYLSLEDGERRIRKRTRQMIPTDQYLDQVQMVYDLPAPLSDEGGLEALNHEIHDGQYELIIVDTFVKAFPQERGPSDLFRADYRQIDALKGLADDNNVALVVIAHTRKEEAEYALNAVARTGGLTAAADAILVLGKTPTGAKLQVISRDIDESEFSLIRDQKTSGWKIAAEGPGPIPNDGKQRILGLLRDQGPLTSNEIQNFLADENGSTVRSWIHRLAADNRILQGLDHKYALSAESSASPLFPEV
jgi:RecA-family ATPase